MAILNSCDLIAFAATRDLKAAIAFYGDRLGLPLIHEDAFAAVFDAHGIMLRVTPVQELTPAQYTVLGWAVPDIAAAAKELQLAGVVLERFAGLEQDELGVWTAPGGGARMAWFKDPDGNVLSVSQHS